MPADADTIFAALRARFGADGLQVVQLAIDAMTLEADAPVEMSAFLSSVACACPWMCDFAEQLADGFLNLREASS